MKKCEKIFKISVPQISKFELSPYDDNGYHVEIQTSGAGYDTISFDVPDYNDCTQLLNYMSNYNYFFVVILTNGQAKFYTSYTNITQFL